MKVKDTSIRNVYWTEEFTEFYEGLSDKVQAKFDYVIDVVKMSDVISAKFVKHLENTDLYEMRVSVGG
jgi:predicted restriction endonuclease